MSLKAAARDGELVLVGLSGGGDSLALAAATAFEAPRIGVRAGAVIIDHQLQEGSAEVAERAAAQARELGLDPVMVVRVEVRDDGQGPEASARLARYEALEATRQQLGAVALLLGHTLDDQAETVLLGLARGSGGKSLHGMAPVAGPLLRPLLGIRRTATHQACADMGLEPWQDPHNHDPKYTRVRVRERVLPMLEEELGPGISEALARTATTLREDAETLDELALEWAREIIDENEDGRISLDVGGLVTQPPALRQRICRIVAEQGFGVSLSRRHTMAVAALATEWHGQGPVDLPGIRVERERGRILFGAAEAHEPNGDDATTADTATVGARGTRIVTRAGGATQIIDEPTPHGEDETR